MNICSRVSGTRPVLARCLVGIAHGGQEEVGASSRLAEAPLAATSAGGFFGVYGDSFVYGGFFGVFIVCDWPGGSYLFGAGISRILPCRRGSSSCLAPSRVWYLIARGSSSCLAPSAVLYALGDSFIFRPGASSSCLAPSLVWYLIA